MIQQTQIYYPFSVGTVVLAGVCIYSVMNMAIHLVAQRVQNVEGMELHIGVLNATSGYTEGHQQHARERQL